MATKQIPALPNATTALEADLLLKRDTASGVDQKLALPVLMDRVSSYLKDPVESVYRETGILPTLDLNFSDAASFPLGLSFNRNSVGTYFDRDGLLKVADPNVPRVEYDPGTRELKGFLIEEERENLLEYSEDFSQSYWAETTCSITSNSIISPDGTLTGTKIFADNGSPGYIMATPSGVSNGDTVTHSVFAKAGEWNWLQLWVYDGDAAVLYGRYNLSTGVVGFNTTGTQASIQNVGNGWYKCTLTSTMAGSSTPARIRIYPTNQSDGATSGDGTSGIYIWGVQLEEGSFPTSYIPTNGVAVTRNADDASMDGADFSDWYKPAQVTFFAEYEEKAPSNSHQLLTIFYEVGRINWGINAANNMDLQVVISSDTFGGNAPNLSAGIYKAAFSIEENNGGLTVDGSNISNDDILSLPVTPTIFNLGQYAATQYLNSHIKRLTYWPARLDNTLLQNITR